jgi:hypothetical protein
MQLSQHKEGKSSFKKEKKINLNGQVALFLIKRQSLVLLFSMKLIGLEMMT